MGKAIFRVSVDRFSKNGTIDYVGDVTRQTNFGVNRYKVACLRMREIDALKIKS